jgi:hypothetical protein
LVKFAEKKSEKTQNEKFVRNKRPPPYLINNAPSDHETIDALCSVEAPTLAANFGDDRSDTEETKEEIADSEYIHSENEALSEDED